MKEFIKKNKKYLMPIIVALLLLVGITYAFFGIRDGIGANTNITLDAEKLEELIFQKGNDINLRATLTNFGEGDGSLSGESTSSATLFASDETNNSARTYQVYLDITDNTFIYTTPDNKPEIIVEVTDPSGNKITSIDGLNPVTVTDAATNTTISGFDITTASGLFPIKLDETITSTNSNTGTTENWTLKITYVNLTTNQIGNEGKTLSAELILSENKIICRGLATDCVTQELYAGVEGNNGIYYTNNAEYRFTGANPNNYVTFNNELWRIIGVFDENSHGRTGENLVKLIKAESLGNYEYDPSDDNSWSDASGGAELKQILNGAYYNSEVAVNLLANCGNSDRGSCDFTTRGLNTEARSMVEEVTWYLGGTAITSYTASEIYTVERGSTIYSGSDFEWAGKIGLMYPSDYGYAAYKEAWTTDLSYYETNSIPENNWMFEGDVHLIEWIITANSSQSSSAFSVFYDGGVYNSLIVINGFATRPSLYLNSSVEITGGTGSEADPFTLN